jgi:hypothetical protein
LRSKFEGRVLHRRRLHKKPSTNAHRNTQKKGFLLSSNFCSLTTVHCFPITSIGTKIVFGGRH